MGGCGGSLVVLWGYPLIILKNRGFSGGNGGGLVLMVDRGFSEKWRVLGKKWGEKTGKSVVSRAGLKKWTKKGP